MKKWMLLFITLLVSISILSVFIYFFTYRKEVQELKKFDIKISQGIYRDKNWDNYEFPINEICVPDANTALAIAEVILSNYQNQGKFKNYYPQTIFEDTQDQIWIISFYPNTTNYIGATFNIAIKKEDATIIKIWLTD